jgi:parvulin-like peptidyl-prolyl isomerase
MNKRTTLLALAGSSLLLNFPVSAQQNGKTTPPVPVTKPAAKPATTTPSNSQAPIPNGPAGVAAEVNGEKINLVDLTRIVEEYKAANPTLKANTPEAKKELDAARAMMLDDMITIRLLVQEAKRRKIVIPPADIDKEVAISRSAYKSEAEFQESLKKDGKTVEDLKRIASDMLAMDELMFQLLADVVVSDDDLAKYYRENLADFTIPESIKARHILLAVNPNSPKEEKDRVKQRATNLITQLNRNADFTALAKNNSDDPLTKNQGGLMPVFTKNQIVKPLETAAFSAAVGKVVGPIETPIGIHILKVEEKIAAKVIPLETVKKNVNLKAALLAQKRQKKIADSVEQFKTAAVIRKYV